MMMKLVVFIVGFVFVLVFGGVLMIMYLWECVRECVLCCVFYLEVVWNLRFVLFLLNVCFCVLYYVLREFCGLMFRIVMGFLD